MSSPKVVLLIIDPQIDFHPGGSLAVAGAIEDSERIAQFIQRNIRNIDEIYVTLDSHHKLHIAHGAYWKNASGDSPAPFTIITNAQVESGEWAPRDPSNLEHAKFYTRELEAKGRFMLCIWPEHCLIGTHGHAVFPALNFMLQKWAGENLKTVRYVNKGMNCGTEMYSVMAAEVPLASDPSTFLNQKLMAELQTADQLIVCGQALSHCVNYSTRDIVDNWKGDKSQIIVMKDGCSPVTGFEASGQQFLSDMADAGLQVLHADEIRVVK